jgi:hypothetical protein
LGATRTLIPGPSPAGQEKGGGWGRRAGLGAIDGLDEFVHAYVYSST